MTAVTTPRPVHPALEAAAVVATAVLVAVGLNVLVHAVGRAMGGSFRFTSAAGPAEVTATTVAGFTAVPLLAGLVVAALVARRWPRLVTLGLVVAPVLALGTIALMTVPADFDEASTVTLALCHVVLVPVSVLALLRLRATRPRRGSLVRSGAWPR